MIQISNLKFKYKNFNALDIENLCINTKLTTALCGANGSGKSTLLKCIAGVIKPSFGSLKIWGKDVSKMGREELKQIAILFPEPCLLKRSVRENFVFALKSRGVLNEFDDRVLHSLSLVGLDESFLQKRHFELSSGQNKRIAFAITLCLRARLNLLDEPTNAVDLNTARLFSKAIEFARSNWNANFIIASHDEKWLSTISDESVFLHNGHVSEFELKNIYEANNGIINFGNFALKLPKNLQSASKVAINQNMIYLNTPDAKFEGLLHSVSLYFGSHALVKIKAGDFLLKCVINANFLKNSEYSTGKKVKFDIDERAFLRIE